MHFSRYRACGCGTSPVQVIQGFADQGLTDQAADASPDIGHITVQQAFAGWCDASLEQSSY